MSSQWLRQLGNLEKYNATKNFLGMDTCIAMSARYTTADNIPLTKEILFPALRILVEAHPLLGVRLDGKLDSSDIAFCRLSSVELSRVVDFSENDNLQVALEKWFTRRFEDSLEDMPLWRVEVLSDNTVIFAMHHAMADGISLMTFHSSLIRALQESVSLPTHSLSSVTVPDRPIAPPVEVAIDVRPSMWKIISVLYQAFVPRYWNRATYAWTGNPTPPVAALDTHVHLLVFKPSDAGRFLHLCRTHNATISSALHELAVAILSRLIIKSADAAKYKTICLAFPLSLREAAGAPPDLFCYYSSNFDAYRPLQPDFSWVRAACVATELQVEKAKAHEILGFMSWLARDFAGLMKGLLGTKRLQGLRISNPGRFVAPTEVEGKWRIGDLFFGQCDSVVGAAMTMNVIGDPAGGLNLTFAWGEKSIDRAFADAFISMFQQAFMDLVA